MGILEPGGSSEITPTVRLWRGQRGLQMKVNRILILLGIIGGANDLPSGVPCGQAILKPDETRLGRGDFI